MMPTVSVILPTLNRASALSRSAGSVLGQSFTDLELIIVDDGSTEDIRAAVQALDDPRARYLRRDSCGGPAAARNSGLAIAQGQFVAFQDSDDFWQPDKLASQMAVVGQAGTEVFCICGLLRTLGNRIREYTPQSNLELNNIITEPVAYSQTWLLPRKTVVAAGGFDERLWVWEDWELLIRLSQATTIVGLQDALVISEQGPDSITSESPTKSFAHAMNLILAKHAPLMDRHRKARSRLEYLLARILLLGNRGMEGRQALYKSIASRPGNLRAWALLAISALDHRLVRRVLNGT